MKEHWQKRFLGLALEVARWSKDPSAKVGAVVVSPDRRRFSVGYNGFPEGVDDDRVRLTDPVVKNRLMVHAEVNAILNARTDLADWSMFITRPCCLECAKAIIQAGIGNVYWLHRDDTGSKWRISHQRARVILTEAGVVWKAI